MKYIILEYQLKLFIYLRIKNYNRYWKQNKITNLKLINYYTSNFK